MAKDKFGEATTVASPRSRSLGLSVKDNSTTSPFASQGTGGEEEKKIKEKLISITTDKDTNVFSDFAKFLEQKLNEHIEKEIKKKLN